MDYISLGINIDKETEGLTPEQREEFKRMLYALHVNGKVKFTPSTDNVLTEFKLSDTPETKAFLEYLDRKFKEIMYRTPTDKPYGWIANLHPKD